MKHDISRNTFDPAKHFSRVLMQQGRVQLDADWNEQVGILLHHFRTLTADLIGRAGGPAGACGFRPSLNKKRDDVMIGPGRYYGDGLLAENEAEVSLRHLWGRDARKERDELDTRAQGSAMMIYLDVWERHISALEDDAIREKALGGPDTAARARIEWAVRAESLEGAAPGAELPANFEKQLLKKEKEGRGRLQAGIEEQEESNDPCVSSPESVYRGMENQLYRVEIHRGGVGRAAGKGLIEKGAEIATFKWSRENGSVVTAWVDEEDGALRLSGPRDRARGFTPGQWVELTDRSRDLAGRRGTLVRVKDVEAGSLTIEPPESKEPFAHENFPDKPLVRAWDHDAAEGIELDRGAIPIEFDRWFALEDGVQVRFPAPRPNEEYRFRTGDYWMIPARAATRDIEWPRDGTAENKLEPRALPPHGIEHHYALLGVLQVKNTGAEVTDLRREFPPLAKPV